MSAILSPILNATKHLSEDAGLGLLKKAFPKLSKFFSGSIAKGFTAGQILNYLGEKSQDRDFLAKMDDLYSKGKLTPEEKILRKKEHERGRVNNLVRSGAAFAGAALSPLAGAALSPGGGQEAQSPENEMMQAQQGNAQQYDPFSAIMQKFPELAQFIQREAQNGSDASMIARRAKSQPFVQKYGPMIDEIENSIDEPFEMLLERLLGSQQPRQAQGQQQGQGSPEDNLLRALQELKKMRGG